MFRPRVRPLQINILIDSSTPVIYKKITTFWENIEHASDIRGWKLNGIAKCRHQYWVSPAEFVQFIKDYTRGLLIKPATESKPTDVFNA
jgi:hypothetical protein